MTIEQAREIIAKYKKLFELHDRTCARAEQIKPGKKRFDDGKAELERLQLELENISGRIEGLRAALEIMGFTFGYHTGEISVIRR